MCAVFFPHEVTELAMAYSFLGELQKKKDLRHRPYRRTSCCFFWFFFTYFFCFLYNTSGSAFNS